MCFFPQINGCFRRKKEGIAKKKSQSCFTHGCHRSGWLWCPGRCSAGPAALSSPASCSGSTGSSCLCAPGHRWTPPQTQNSARSGRCPVRIPAPGEAHRSEIRAAAPPWHRGGCDHNQVSRERAVTRGCTCATLQSRGRGTGVGGRGGGGRNQTEAARMRCVRAPEMRMDGANWKFWC